MRSNRTLSREEAERFLPPGFIDPPSTSEPLTRWKEFLAGFETWPQHNEVVKRMRAWTTEVIAWKISGEKGPAPERSMYPRATTAIEDAMTDQLESDVTADVGAKEDQ